MKNNSEQKEYLCQCTNCKSIFLDENPGDQLKSEISKITDDIRNMKEFIDEDGVFYGCDICETDEYLKDIEL